MPDADHGPVENGPAQTLRKNSRRRRAVIGVTGLALVIGTGSYVITDHMTARDDTETQEASAQQLPVTASEDAVTPDKTTPSPTSATTRAAAAEAKKPEAKVSSEIITARSRAAADGVPLMRARTPSPKLSSDDVKVLNSGSPESGKTLKVVSARGDLTGYEELSWIGDESEPVGPAKCTQKFQLSTEVEATERPTLLVCWRTTEKKSVYTVAVNFKGRPSKNESLAALKRAWSQLS